MLPIPEHMTESKCPVCKHEENKAILYDGKCYVWYECESCGQQYKVNTKYVIIG